ncbi:MAG TPA: hypothetical protein PKD86_09190 [Gemmatales bacterium]|mgnify:CR=1 FL=1|nr:hypothetical protein [Gemmatales bacterium]HMP59513.1 hypothetical protein [Gemmatales bacterium]
MAAEQPAQVPGWAKLLGSLAIAFHLLAVVVAALDAPSGPWPTPMGPQRGDPPAFAFQIAEHLTLPYAQFVKVAGAYRFESNRLEVPDIQVEARVRDAEGRVVANVKLPDPTAPLAVQYRQKLLVTWLRFDQPLPPPQSVLLAPQGGVLPKVRWWEPDGDRRMRLIEDDANSVPRNRPVMEPMPSAYRLATAVARHLCRAHGGDRAEIVRLYRDPIPPAVLVQGAPPTADELRGYQATYGDLPK